jgi:glycerol-3-phosphate acyltransferase PlsY
VFLFGFQPMGAALLVVCALLIWRHRSNIQNLMNGTESRIGSKKKTLASGDKGTS